MGEISSRRFVVRGRVQAVGFRSFALRRALEAGVRGWVRNLPDGSVESLAEGRAAALDAFEEALRAGPRLAWVEAVDVFEEPPGGGGNGFVIRM